MDDVIDRAWDAMLAAVLKKRTTTRSGIGDEIHLFVPQSRLLSLVEADSAIPRLVYTSARDSARRNAATIMNKLGMPADYFWKFEYWPKTRAFTTLEKIVERVFSSIMRQANEGELKITGLSVDPLEIDISFNDCAECAGISGIDQGMCFYHAGTFSGILSGLIHRDLEGFETECRAAGNAICRFTVYDSKEGGFDKEQEAYLSFPAPGIDIPARLRDALTGAEARKPGNMVDIGYLQLAMANTLLTDPETYARVSYEAGLKLGKQLAPVLRDFFDTPDIQTIAEYYLRMGAFHAEVNGDISGIMFVISECAESAGAANNPEMTAFLAGELQGLLSELMETEMKPEEMRFENETILITFVPAG